MPAADNARHLARAASQRHRATLTRANDAIEHLDRTGQPITFSGVATAASVSRAWLYRQPDIRDLINRLRSSPARSVTTPASQRATPESLRSRLDATRAEITRLRAENAMLRDEAARRLGQDRAHPGANIHPSQP
jgi:hypothetical protein